MWIDDASKIDMLSYKPFAELLYRIINNERMSPLTIGLYGSWGAGKSTILKLTEDIIIEKQRDNDKKIVSVNINSWMFEGYDDAKCALMESLLRSIERKPQFSETSKKKIKELFKNVDYLRLGAAAIKKGIPLATSLVTGNPVPFLLNISGDILSKFNSEDGIQEIYDSANKFSEKFIKPNTDNEESSVVNNIRVFKSEFKEILEQSDIDNLVVMIDDLDRCTPDKIIDTLEAIKLFLSAPRTAFIIAVDERVIKYSIRKKYPSIDNDSVDISKDYVEKIIQLPVNIPELSEIDIMNYMILLVSELYLNKELLNDLLRTLYEDGIFYNGSRITSSKIANIINLDGISIEDFASKEEYIELTNVVEKTSEIVSSILKGNPRQAKRFLNTFLVRKNMAEIYYGETNDIKIEVLAKLLALEYIDVDLFRKLNEWHNGADGGEIGQLKELYELVSNDKEIPAKYGLWDNDKMKNWIKSEPERLYEDDLSKYLYLCRESLAGEINSIDNLTKEEKEILKKIINATKGKEKEEIMKLRDIHQDSANKIIKVIIKMFKEKKGRMLNVGIIYENFEQWRYEILEHIRQHTKSDINMSSAVLIQMIYKVTPTELDELLTMWQKKKMIDNRLIKIIKGE